MNRQLLVLAALGACSFGGSDEDPTRPVDGPSPDASLLDATMPGDAAVAAARDAASPPAPPIVRRDASVATNLCLPRAPIAVCDPVRNTGCPPLTQCDIDTGATTPTGRCVFPATALAEACAGDFLSQTCGPQSTCVDQTCRKMCYCDDDCGAGACCSDASGPGPAGVFKLCEPC